MTPEQPDSPIRPNEYRFSYNSFLLMGFIPVVLAVWYCVRHLDTGLALYVKQHAFGNSAWARYTSSIPDALLYISLSVTTLACAGFWYRASHARLDATTLTCKLLACAVPLSYAAKSILKYVFGRINTRVWLIAPHEYGFHWFQGSEQYSGFPSGHMAVFTALIAVFWRLHPRLRGVGLAMLLLLAGALIATNYHFLSDVIAGTYVGLLAEVLAWHIAGRDRRFQGVSG